MPSSAQTWPWRKSESMSGKHRRPPTWRSALSHPPSPSQRRPCPPARVAAPTAPHPPPSRRRPPSFCLCQRSAPGRSRPRKPWRYRIRAAGIRSSNCPASSPGTPVPSQNERRGRCVARWNSPRPPVSKGCLPSTSHNAPPATPT